jgi:DNA-directed RNA polymerase specialized sigma54-like protein
MKDKIRKKESQDFFDECVELAKALREEVLHRDDVIIVVAYPKAGATGPVNFFSTNEKQLSSMIMASVAKKLMNDTKKEQ